MQNKKCIRKGKRKEIVFRDEDWLIVEKNAAALKMNTTKYITHAALNNNIKVIDFKELSKLSNELNAIGNNINQLARKANETNNIYADDYKHMKENYEKLCHTLNRKISELLHYAA